MRLALLCLLCLPLFACADVIGVNNSTIDRNGSSVTLTMASSHPAVAIGWWGDEVAAVDYTFHEFGVDVTLTPLTTGLIAVAIGEADGTVSYFFVYVDDKAGEGEFGLLPYLDPNRANDDPRP